VTTPVLAVLLGGRRIGEVRAGRGGRVELTYDDTYRSDPDAVVLSLSLPLVARAHRGPAVEAFLWGLLPDNDRILEGWGRRFHVSARSALAVLAHVGEECPGAVQLVAPHRANEFERAGEGAIEWLDVSDVAARLRGLRADPAAWRSESDAGQLSLAGAQPKTALLFQNGRWGVPSGRTPTTHILKPPLMDLEGLAENEHACLCLARELGLSAARSEVKWFEDELAIIVERFDRVRMNDDRILRVHQEDLCQALGIHPANKYENNGGPGAATIVRLLRDHSARPEVDVDRFVGALIMSWLIGATDAHGKNYALLHGAQRRVRLAPLYDVASILPYGVYNPQKTKLAMRIGGKYRLHDIGLPAWKKTASELAISDDDLIDRIRQLTRDVVPAFDAVRQRLRSEGLHHGVLDRMAKAIEARTKAARP
jgi:serine/threonine-protein kinase HipA